MKIFLIITVLMTFCVGTYAYDSTKKYLWQDPNQNGSAFKEYNLGDPNYVFKDTMNRTQTVSFISASEVFRVDGGSGETSIVWYHRYTGGQKYSYYNSYQGQQFRYGSYIIDNPDYVDLADPTIYYSVFIQSIWVVIGLIVSFIFIRVFRL
jgi:hypothetical protein